MSVSIKCQNCRKQYRFREGAPGDQIQCPGCGQVIAARKTTQRRRDATATQKRSSLSCPACRSVRLNERKLKSGMVVDTCPSCRGTWLDGGELLPLTVGKQAARESVTYLKWDSTESERICPRCRSRMVEGEFLGTNTNVDYCQDCEGLWFDARELKSVLKTLEATPDRADLRKVIPPTPISNQCIKPPTDFSKPEKIAPSSDSYGVKCRNCGSTRWVTKAQGGSTLDCVVCHKKMFVPVDPSDPTSAISPGSSRSNYQPARDAQGPPGLLKKLNSPILFSLTAAILLLLILVAAAICLLITHWLAALPDLAQSLCVLVVLGLIIVSAGVLCGAVAVHHTRCPACRHVFGLKPTGLKRHGHLYEYQCRYCGEFGLKRKRPRRRRIRRDNDRGAGDDSGCSGYGCGGEYSGCSGDGCGGEDSGCGGDGGGGDGCGGDGGD